jgi:hypothetical protein
VLFEGRFFHKQGGTAPPPKSDPCHSPDFRAILGKSPLGTQNNKDLQSLESLYHTTLDWSDPGETRTLGPLIKSQLLYQLSYGVRN